MAGQEARVTRRTVFSSLLSGSRDGLRRSMISCWFADQGMSLLIWWVRMNCFQVGRSIVIVLLDMG